jgi:biotin carboxylase
MTVARRRAGLFLGIDPYVLRACRRAELDAVVVVGAGTRDFGLHNAPDWATVLSVDDQTSAESVLIALARNAGLAERISFVQSTDERALVCAAVVAQALGADGLDVGTVLRFRDKSVQKRVVRRAGIRVARTIVIDDIRALDPAAVDLFPRSVLKPVAGAGTSLTSVIDDRGELEAAVRLARISPSGPRTFILEEFVSGRELTADGVMVDGELAFLALGCYEQPCLTTITAQGRMQTYKLDPRADASVYDRVTPTVRDALAALGLRDGVFHMELFHDADADAVWFSECAARRGGGLIHEEVHRKFSVDLGDAALRAAAGLIPKIEPAVAPGVVGATFLPQREGILLDCPTAEDLLKRPSVEYARIELPTGFQMRGSVSDTIGRVGQVMFRAPTLPALLAASDDTVEWFCERMTVLPTTLSPAELRDRQRLDQGLDGVAALAAVA